MKLSCILAILLTWSASTVFAEISPPTTSYISEHSYYPSTTNNPMPSDSQYSFSSTTNEPESTSSPSYPSTTLYYEEQTASPSTASYPSTTAPPSTTSYNEEIPADVKCVSPVTSGFYEFMASGVAQDLSGQSACIEARRKAISLLPECTEGCFDHGFFLSSKDLHVETGTPSGEKNLREAHISCYVEYIRKCKNVEPITPADPDAPSKNEDYRVDDDFENFDFINDGSNDRNSDFRVGNYGDDDYI